jgi:hypothetical protein
MRARASSGGGGGAAAGGHGARGGSEPAAADSNEPAVEEEAEDPILQVGWGGRRSILATDAQHAIAVHAVCGGLAAAIVAQ